MDNQTTNVGNSLNTTDTPHHSRVGVVWLSLIVFVFLLLLLVVFILQNSKAVQIHYFGSQASVPFGVSILLAAVIGSLLTLLIGSIRIVQLKLSKKSFR